MSRTLRTVGRLHPCQAQHFVGLPLWWAIRLLHFFRFGPEIRLLVTSQLAAELTTSINSLRQGRWHSSQHWPICAGVIHNRTLGMGLFEWIMYIILGDRWRSKGNKWCFVLRRLCPWSLPFVRFRHRCSLNTALYSTQQTWARSEHVVDLGSPHPRIRRLKVLDFLEIYPDTQGCHPSFCFIAVSSPFPLSKGFWRSTHLSFGNIRCLLYFFFQLSRSSTTL